LCGYYAQQIRMDPPDRPTPKIPEWTRVIPQYLKPAGYRCYHSGKWHLHGAPRACADAGFDHSYKIDDQDRHFAPTRLYLDDKQLPPVDPNSGFYATVAIADHAVKMLKEHAAEHADQPFFEYLAFTVPHFPIMAPQEDIDRYRDHYTEGWDVLREQRWERQKKMGIVNCALSARDPVTVPSWNYSEEQLKKEIGPGEVGRAVAWTELNDVQKKFQSAKMSVHAAMIDRMDREIGRVIDQVKAMGALDDTVIFFLSDNGASAEQIIRGEGNDPTAPIGSAKSFLGIGPGWSTAANTPLRLHKSWVHEGGISTPLIVQWPKGIAAHGELRHSVGHVVDFVPTLLDLAGITPDEKWHDLKPPPFPGKSLVPAFATDAKIDHDFIFYEHDGHGALRMGDWKVVSLFPDHQPWELYDLSKDRCEMVDLASSQHERVSQMAAKWAELEAQFRQEAGGPATRPTGKSSEGGEAKQAKKAAKGKGKRVGPTTKPAGPAEND
jgi:arylsulfatase